MLHRLRAGGGGAGHNVLHEALEHRRRTAHHGGVVVDAQTVDGERLVIVAGCHHMRVLARRALDGIQPRGVRHELQHGGGARGAAEFGVLHFVVVVA